MEELLQYVWGHKLMPPGALALADGRPVHIIDPGRLNRDSGPDFFNAKVKIDGRLWCGNVEIHVRASDWFRHGHHDDRAYDSVILHVVAHDDCEVSRPDGQIIPQLKMQCAADYSHRFGQFVNAPSATLPCASSLAEIPPLYMRDWIDSMAFERINAKSERILGYLARFNGSWEDAAYVTLARALGTGINAEPFERLALATPLRLMLKHSDSLTAIEAILFGQAGLIPQNPGGYAATLEREYQFLAHKFSLHPVESPGWKMARMRPAAFPHRRIAVLALMISDGFRFMQRVLDVDSEESARAIFTTPALSGHWLSHFSLDATPTSAPPSISRATADVLIINVVAPLLFAYGNAADSHRHSEMAIDLLEHLPPERNSLVALFEHSGISCPNAFTSQALIELRRAYCDARKCLYCRIGHRILASKTTP